MGCVAALLLVAHLQFQLIDWCQRKKKKQKKQKKSYHTVSKLAGVYVVIICACLVPSTEQNALAAPFVLLLLCRRGTGTSMSFQVETNGVKSSVAIPILVVSQESVLVVGAENSWPGHDLERHHACGQVLSHLGGGFVNPALRCVAVPSMDTKQNKTKQNENTVQQNPSNSLFRAGTLHCFIFFWHVVLSI